jgi:hypothetical protein
MQARDALLLRTFDLEPSGDDCCNAGQDSAMSLLRLGWTIQTDADTGERQADLRELRSHRIPE